MMRNRGVNDPVWRARFGPAPCGPEVAQCRGTDLGRPCVRAVQKRKMDLETLVSTNYVERRDDTFMIGGTRVSLDSIVHAFVSGASAETIAQAFPVLNLEQVYGAITFYLAHREEVDRYLAARQQDFDAQREASRKADPMFYQKLADAKRQIPLAG